MKFGLPLEYQKFPEFFDADNILFNSADDFEKSNSVIEKILEKYQAKTVIDLTCGTGSQVFYLTKKGYKVIGSDFSPQLLEIARRKAKSKNLEIDFVDGDMRTTNLGIFDACITMFNAVGHVTKKDFKKTIENIFNNLKDGGIYVFDIFNLSAMNEEVVSKFAYQSHKISGDTQMLKAQVSCLEKKNGWLTSYDNYTIQKNVEKPQMFISEFTLQIYTENELNKMLIESGFKVVRQYDLNGSEFIPNQTINMLTVAQK